MREETEGTCPLEPSLALTIPHPPSTPTVLFGRRLLLPALHTVRRVLSSLLPAGLGPPNPARLVLGVRREFCGQFLEEVTPDRPLL
jgi:hypothetical protein